MTARKMFLSLCLAFLCPPFSQAQLQCPPVCNCEVNLNGDGIIDCRYRNLTEVPSVYIPGASKIAKVDLSNNLLTSLDIRRLYTYIAGLTIDELDFSFNAIKNISGSFDALAGRDFETLNLSSNAFSIFPPNAIPINHHRSKLVIDISHNRLTELTSQMFADGNDFLIPGFQFLAKNNSISKIADDTFQGVDLVNTVIDLRFNRLTTLSPGFQSPRGVESLRLSSNPWYCDCNLRWIIQTNRFLVNHTALDPPNCFTPRPLLDRPIFSLKPNEFTCLPYQLGSLTRNYTNEVNFTLTCPVTADPPNPEISWDMWVPCPGRVSPLHFSFTAETITVSDVETNPNSAFRCTATNNAGSVAFDLDVRYNGQGGIPIPGNDDLSNDDSHTTMTSLTTYEGVDTTLMTADLETRQGKTESSSVSKYHRGSNETTTTFQPEVENTNKMTDFSTFADLTVSNDGGSSSTEHTTTIKVTSSRGGFSHMVSSISSQSSRIPSSSQQPGVTTTISIDQTSSTFKKDVNSEYGESDLNGATEIISISQTLIIVFTISVITACLQSF